MAKKTQENRVFQDQIGKWPSVYDRGNQTYEVIAVHKSPKAVQSAVGMTKFLAVIFGIFLFAKIAQSDWAFLIGFAVIGALLFYLIVRQIATNTGPIVNRRTIVKFHNGTISWGKNVIGPDENRIFRSERHRAAAAEAREFQAMQVRTNRQPIYQLSSEVFIDTGEGLMHPRLVTAIADDESLEWAHLLSSTLRLVDRHSRQQAGRAVRVAKSRVSLD